MSKHLVFVYGTLKRNEPNHQVMSNTLRGVASFAGTARMTQKYPLIISTQYNIPFLLKDAGNGEYVQGELYNVEDEKLVELDELENHPHFYVRHEEKFELISDKNGEKIKGNVIAWVYLLPTWTASLLEQGTTPLNWYSSLGEHGRAYVEK
ncbi:unnamed protein product [Bursaphelenchus okinawaensis]|uniref:Gamma-glutamylcyclotransferase family protein n=1 Tax=Bursaphelenchus okinawaensis TaxID=465554 RepID=A0A811KC51_9BILA|nr:unnamed protein product [Bursaphelenchus okinawaensis]CAG9100701.1 unnamed protein product [Bursaphelenchus okinawaensis]